MISNIYINMTYYRLYYKMYFKGLDKLKSTRIRNYNFE